MYIHIEREICIVQAKYVLVKKSTALVNVLVYVFVETMFGYRCICIKRLEPTMFFERFTKAA